MRTRIRDVGVVIGVVSTLALGVVGCRSADTSSGHFALIKIGAANPNEVYVKGVPTLNALYKGGLTLPPTSGPKPKKGANVWWISCGQAIEGCSAPAAAGQQAAKELGFDFHIADGGLNKDGGVAGAIQTAIAGGAKAMVLWGISCEDAAQPIAEARNKGIIAMGGQSDDCNQYSGNGGGNPQVTKFEDMEYSSTMTDASKFWDGYGSVSADYIIDESEGHAKLLINSGNFSTTKDIDVAFRKEFAKCTTCKIVYTVPWALSDLGPDGPWSQAFRTAVIKEAGQFNSVYFPFDGFSTEWGGLDALQQAGLKGIVTFGGLGLPDAVQSVREGGLTALTSSIPNGLQGWAAMDEINRALNGWPRSPEGYGFTLITQSHNLPPSGQPFVGNVNWMGAYLKSWGVKS
jgi:ribose transport system substrate-binding protein